MPQGYIKEATYQFSDLYLPGKSSNSWGRGGQTKRDTQTDKQTNGMQLYIYRYSRQSIMSYSRQITMLYYAKTKNIILQTCMMVYSRQIMMLYSRQNLMLYSRQNLMLYSRQITMLYLRQRKKLPKDRYNAIAKSSKVAIV